jgi:UDP-glucose 4-epimerase
MESSLKILAKVHGFEYVITRPHNVYGPRQNMGDPYRNVVTIFMNSLLSEKPYYIYGDGEQRRCFSYIDDVVSALFKCGFNNVNSMIFNIGSDRDYSISELSEVIQKVSKKNTPPIHLAARPQEVKVAIADHSLSKKYLGYKDETSLQKGIIKTWKYAQKLGYQKPKFSEIELPNPNLPENWRVAK